MVRKTGYHIEYSTIIEDAIFGTAKILRNVFEC